MHTRRGLCGRSVHPEREHERGWAQSLHTCQVTGKETAEAKEGLPILETALIAYEMTVMFLSHECYSISKAQGIHKAGFLCPPANAFIYCDRVEWLLESAPFDTRDDIVGFVLHGSLLCKVLRGCTVRKSIRDGRERTTRRGPSF